eukprot:5551254-Amphidinium_carterae.1
MTNHQDAAQTQKRQAPIPCVNNGGPTQSDRKHFVASPVQNIFSPKMPHDMLHQDAQFSRIFSSALNFRMLSVRIGQGNMQTMKFRERERSLEQALLQPENASKWKNGAGINSTSEFNM